MAHITSLFAHKVVSVVEASIDRDTLLKSIGLRLEGPIDPSVMISDVDYYSILENIVRAERAGHTLSLRAGAAMRCDDYGALGLAFKSAFNLAGFLNRLARYSPVLTSVTEYSIETTDKGVFFDLLRKGERRLGMRISNEASIASIFSVSQEVAIRKVQPLAVYFKHPAPKSIDEHKEYFGCPVCFGSDRDALLFSHESLAVENILGDTGISTFFDRHLDGELAQIGDDNALDTRVKIQLAQALSEGVPTITDIASKLAMSARTLQRKLSDQGLSFQSLVDDARRELAEQLLASTKHSLAEVAFLTGFSEQSSFNRAFKRWAGQTPRSYRLLLHSK